MAFVIKNLVVGPDIEAPAGHTQTETEPAIAGVDIKEDVVLTIGASAFAAATAAAGFDALFVDIESEVDTYIGTTLGVDTVGNSIDYNAIVKKIEHKADSDIYKHDATRNLDVTVLLNISGP